MAEIPIIRGLRHTPVEPLEARRRACELVRRGHFAAARMLALEFEERPGGRASEWALALAAVASYFEGRFHEARQYGKRARWAGALQHLKRLLHDPLPECLHVALSAEAALVAGDVVNASRLTTTFFDNAVLDAVDRTLRKDPKKTCVDWEQIKIPVLRTRLSRPDLERLVSETTANPKLLGDWIGKVGLRELHDIPDEHDFRPRTLVRRLFLIRALADPLLGKAPALAKSLQDVARALYSRPPSPCPADLRNVLSHSSASERQLNAAREIYTNRGLWADVNRPSGLGFLGKTKPSAVLTALDVTSAPPMYADLVEGLVADLRSAPLG
jgi:hypothetical protein